MDCSPFSSFQIGLFNFALSILPWFPAVYVFIQITVDLDEVIDTRWPGYDNQNLRTALSIGAMIMAFVAFVAVWWAGLLLTERFRCAFI